LNPKSQLVIQSIKRLCSLVSNKKLREILPSNSLDQVKWAKVA